MCRTTHTSGTILCDPQELHPSYTPAPLSMDRPSPQYPTPRKDAILRYFPQLAGRSAFAPVHCPLWPAPFPPLVGGDGLANAGLALTSPMMSDRTTMSFFTVCLLIGC